MTADQLDPGPGYTPGRARSHRPRAVQEDQSHLFQEIHLSFSEVLVLLWKGINNDPSQNSSEAFGFIDFITYVHSNNTFNCEVFNCLDIWRNCQGTGLSQCVDQRLNNSPKSALHRAWLWRSLFSACGCRMGHIPGISSLIKSQVIHFYVNCPFISFSPL